jgi:hypothetical protein
MRRLPVKSEVIEWCVSSGVIPLGGGPFKEVPCLISRDGVHVIALNGHTAEEAKRLYAQWQKVLLDERESRYLSDGTISKLLD